MCAVTAADPTTRAGTLTAAWACGAAASTPAIAIAPQTGAALAAFSAALCACDGAVCLPVRLIFRGRSCVCAEFTALPLACPCRCVIDRLLRIRADLTGPFTTGAWRKESAIFWPEGKRSGPFRKSL